MTGGYSRTSAVDKPLILDASRSKDANINPSLNLPSNLTFSWRCTIASIVGYGSDCKYVFSGDMSKVAKASQTIVNMTLGERYLVTVTATAADGRSDSADIQVTPVSPGAAQVLLTSLSTRFNRPNVLQLFARVQSSAAQMVTWSLKGDSNNLDLGPLALTKVSKNFTAIETQVGVVYPLSIGANTFTPGRLYTFRLTSSSIGFPAQYGFGEITLECNSPPTSGILNVLPRNGTAVVTKFLMQSDNWYDSDYPLYYTFKYTLQTSSGNVTTLTNEIAYGNFYIVMSKSEKKFINSPLPNGIQSMGYAVTCLGEVADSLGAASYGSREVTVFPLLESQGDVALFLANSLTDSLSTAFSSGNMDIVLQSINVAASTISLINCSLASPTYCTSLNREVCSVSAQTCGFCLDGFVGVVGPANRRCVRASAGGHPGQNCTVDGDCIYGPCRKGFCSVAHKLCPSLTQDMPCSGNGYCRY